MEEQEVMPGAAHQGTRTAHLSSARDKGLTAHQGIQIMSQFRGDEEGLTANQGIRTSRPSSEETRRGGSDPDSMPQFSRRRGSSQLTGYPDITCQFRGDEERGVRLLTAWQEMRRAHQDVQIGCFS